MSVTSKITSASTRDPCTNPIMDSCSVYFGLMMPGVSANTIWASSVFTIPRIWCLVVCALGVIIDIFSPTSLFISVDLPAFGFPMILTNPALCDILSFYYLLCKETNYIFAVQLGRKGKCLTAIAGQYFENILRGGAVGSSSGS